MCGIVGWINSPQTDKKQLEKALLAIAHRGPDAKGTFINDSDALGHVRLSIQDLSISANQPMIGDQWVLVFNGEIYNYIELREKYQLNCQTTSDTEVLLKGFEKVGEKIFSELNGMYAFALYSKQSKKVILCRDRVGIKPLYLYDNGKSFAFASELKAFKVVQWIKQSLTILPDAVTNFLHLGYIPSPQTIYKEVIKFPAGHYAEIENGSIKLHEYWSPEQSVHKETIKEEGLAKEQLKELLNQSIKLRLRSDVPFGTFLSGGIDSSLVTAIAQKNTSKALNTFSIGFQESSHNEAEFAKEIAKNIGTNHHEFYVSVNDAKNLVESLVGDYDEPYADSSAIPMMLVSKLARSEVKMTLSGDGGDEMFMGYGFYNWARRLSNPVVKAFRPMIGYGLKMGDLRMQRAADMFLSPGDQQQSHIFSQEQYYFKQSEINALLLKPTRVSEYLNTDFDVARNFSPAEKQSFFDLKYYLKDELLTKVDIATMKYGLENRVPLLDHNIVEFALNLDEGLKNKGGEAKYLLKQVLYDYVDKSLFDRPKQGFSIPLAKWLKGSLSAKVEEMLSPEVTKKVGWLNVGEVQKVLKKFKGGRDYYFNRVWAIMIFHQWYLENHIE